MSGKHGHKPFEGHMHDYMAHIKAVEEDLEYYRAKRFEPRVIYLLRRGVVTFYDLLKVRVTLKKKAHFFSMATPKGHNRICQRHRAGFRAHRRRHGYGDRGQPKRARRL
jgi:hypothetical protein